MAILSSRADPEARYDDALIARATESSPTRCADAVIAAGSGGEAERPQS